MVTSVRNGLIRARCVTRISPVNFIISLFNSDQMIIFYLITCSLLKNVYSEDSSEDGKEREIPLKELDFAIVNMLNKYEQGQGERLLNLIEKYNKRLEDLISDIGTSLEKVESVVKVLLRMRGPAFFNTKFEDSIIARGYGFSAFQMGELKTKLQTTKEIIKNMKYVYESKSKLNASGAKVTSKKSKMFKH